MRKVVKPKASALIMSMRSIGYSFNNAVADIIDNSISAKASKIDIICNWDGNEPYIEIRDDGVGMNADQLEEAMRLGSDPNDTRDPDDLGRFGLGLKTASFSQAKKLIDGVALQKELANKGIIVHANTPNIMSEEAPNAYKDVDEVISITNSAKLTKPLARMNPLAVIKG